MFLGLSTKGLAEDCPSQASDLNLQAIPRCARNATLRGGITTRSLTPPKAAKCACTTLCQAPFLPVPPRRCVLSLPQAEKYACASFSRSFLLLAKATGCACAAFLRRLPSKSPGTALSGRKVRMRDVFPLAHSLRQQSTHARSSLSSSPVASTSSSFPPPPPECACAAFSSTSR